MSRFVRASKVRNIYPDVAKPDNSFRGYKFKQTGASDAQGIKANDLYIALSVATGAGSIAIDKIAAPQRVGATPPVLFHTNFAVDFDFSPFHSNLIASGDDAGSVFVWGIPEGGLTENVSEPLVEFDGIHNKSVNIIQFHPTASHVLASGSGDGLVKLYDVENEKEIWTSTHGDPLHSIAFSDDGVNMATTCKDKKLRFLDTRTSEAVAEKVCHPGSKTAKAIFLDNFGAGQGNLATVGFTVQAKRQLKLWDRRKLTTEISKQDIDSTNSVFMPFYDPTLNMLYLQGRGETKCFIYELVDDAPWQFQVFNEPVSKEAVRGACMIPKRCVDVMRDGGNQNKGPEVARMYQVSTKQVTPVSWVIPRKNTKFWPEIFPDAYAGVPSLTAEEFFAGKKSSKPKLKSMNPKAGKGEEKKHGGISAVGGGPGGLKKVAPASGGGDDIASLKAEIARLKKILDGKDIKY